MKLKNKVAIITGGDRGIGKATAERFVKEGAKVVIANRNAENGSKFVAELVAQGYEAIYVQTDVSIEDSVANLFDVTVEKYGSVDIVCANAGIARADDANTTTNDWKKVIDINLNGVYTTNRFAILQMLKQENGGSIVNLASVHSIVANPYSSSYSASKGGVKMLTQALATQYARKKIRVNAVSPGYIATDMTNKLDSEVLEKLHPIGRLGTTEEVANAILFLASDEASFITGSSLVVDGGYSII